MKPLSKKSGKEEARSEAKAKLRKLVKQGGIVYTALEHRSTSGMTRHISCYVVSCREIENITYYVANLLGYRRAKNTGGLVVTGCGMDMGFHVVYNLGRTLFPKGGPLEKTSPSRRYQEMENGRETDGGYLIEHKWL